jgi:uncharacterized coiled-coil protein SlyX
MTALLFFLLAPAIAQDTPIPLAADPVVVEVPADAPAEPTSAETARDLLYFESQIESLQREVERRRIEMEQTQAEMKRLTEELRQSHGPSAPPTSIPERVGFGQEVRVRVGEQVEDVVAFGRPAFVEGEVLGDATSFGGHIQVGPHGIIHGDAVSFGGQIIVHPGGMVHGDRVTMAVPMSSEAMVTQALPTDSMSLLSRAYSHLILFLSFAGAGVLVIGLFPSRVSRIATTLDDFPIRSAIAGIFASTTLSITSLVFAVTLIGLPVSFLLIALLGLAWLMGFVGLCQAVGDKLPFRQKPHGRWFAFLVGTLVLTSIGALPFLGWLVVIAASMMGTGAALASWFGAR